MSTNKDFTLIIPCYNSEKNIAKLFKQLVKVNTVIDLLNEIIFIDDGSTDNTWSQLNDCKKEYSNVPVKLLQNKINQGKGASILRAFNNISSASKYVLFTDSDLPYGVNNIAKFFQQAQVQNAGIIIGDRTLEKKHRQNYTIMRLLYKKLMRRLIPKIVADYRDTQAGIKLFKRETLKYFKLVKTKRWVTDIEMLVIAEENNLKVDKIPVSLVEEPTPGGVFLFSHGFQILKDLYLINRTYAKGGYQFNKQITLQ